MHTGEVTVRKTTANYCLQKEKKNQKRKVILLWKVSKPQKSFGEEKKLSKTTNNFRRNPSLFIKGENPMRPQKDLNTDYLISMILPITEDKNSKSTDIVFQEKRSKPALKPLESS